MLVSQSALVVSTSLADTEVSNKYKYCTYIYLLVYVFTPTYSLRGISDGWVRSAFGFGPGDAGYDSKFVHQFVPTHKILVAKPPTLIG